MRTHYGEQERVPDARSPADAACEDAASAGVSPRGRAEKTTSQGQSKGLRLTLRPGKVFVSFVNLVRPLSSINR